MAEHLTPAVLHILLALVDGERHGYGIMQEIEVISGGHLKVGPGTLYRSIRQMLADGQIEELDERPDEDDERRRYYRLTEKGGRVAKIELTRLTQLINSPSARQLLKGV